jgi:hypothetical protein
MPIRQGRAAPTRDPEAERSNFDGYADALAEADKRTSTAKEGT